MIIDTIIYAIVINGIYQLLIKQPIVKISDMLKPILLCIAIYCFVGMIGFLFAKYDVFACVDKKLKNLFSPQKIVIMSIVIGIVIMGLRLKLPLIIFESISFDAIYTPILVYTLVNVVNGLNIRIMEKILISLGMASMNIWFLHGIFFSPNRTIQWLAYWPKYSILILVWTLALVFVCAIPINYVQKKVISFIDGNLKGKDTNE